MCMLPRIIPSPFLLSLFQILPCSRFIVSLWCYFAYSHLPRSCSQVSLVCSPFISRSHVPIFSFYFTVLSVCIMASNSGESSPATRPSLPSFHPKPGDLVLARWVEDGVYYRAMFLRNTDPVHSLLDFLEYGTGLSRSDDLCKDLADLPDSCLIDQYLQREAAYAARMKRRLASAL